MYIIAGLGNPGREYEMTRHNIGFEVIDYLADKYNIKVSKLKFKGIYGEMNIGGEKVLVIKPQTYMNLSGDCIVEFKNFFKIPTENIIIINDDIDIEQGRLRIRAKGSAGTHNGLKSIIYQLQADNFPRIRVGVGAPRHKEYDLADFVLGRFTKDEIPVMEKAIINAADAAVEIVKSGIDKAMNIYNAK